MSEKDRVRCTIRLESFYRDGPRFSIKVSPKLRAFDQPEELRSVAQPSATLPLLTAVLLCGVHDTDWILFDNLL